MKKTVIFFIVFLIVLAAVILWSVYHYNNTYKVNDITGEYAGAVYSLPDGERTGDEIISFTGEMEHPKNGFDRIDGTVTVRGKTFNIKGSPIDPLQRFYLTGSDGSYFGTLFIYPKKPYNITKTSFYLMPEIDLFAILIGGSEEASSYDECTGAVFFAPDMSDGEIREMIFSMIDVG